MAPTEAPSPYLVAKALTHPMRAKVLEILDRRIASPVEISNQLGIGVSHVSYHVKVLREFECIELVARRKRRGATEHRYRAVARPFLCDGAWARVSPTARQGVSDALLKIIGEEACAALAAGTLGARHDTHLSRTPLTLDQTGWRDLAELLESTLDRVLTIKDESEERLEHEETDTITSNLAILHFETPSQAQQSPSDK